MLEKSCCRNFSVTSSSKTKHRATSIYSRARQQSSSSKFEQHIKVACFTLRGVQVWQGWAGFGRAILLPKCNPEFLLQNKEIGRSITVQQNLHQKASTRPGFFTSPPHFLYYAPLIRRPKCPRSIPKFRPIRMIAPLCMHRGGLGMTCRSNPALTREN